MKQAAFYTAALMLLSCPSFAQQSQRTEKTTTTTTKTVTETESTGSPPERSGRSGAAATDKKSGDGSLSVSSRPRFSAGASVGSAADNLHFGGMFQIDFSSQLENQSFRLGGQTGFLFGPTEPETWIVPILLTGTYVIPTTGDLKPYLGVGFGLSLTHVSGVDVPNPLGGTTTVGDATNTDFAVLVKPGANFGDGNQWFAEVPFGSLGSAFAILPTVGFHF